METNNQEKVESTQPPHHTLTDADTVERFERIASCSYSSRKKKKKKKTLLFVIRLRVAELFFCRQKEEKNT